MHKYSIGTNGASTPIDIDAMDERQYTRFIIDTMERGNTPALDAAKAGPFATIIGLLLTDYKPTKLESFRRSLDALKNLHKQFKDVLEETSDPVGILMSDVRPEKVSWLWKPRLALGKIAMLDGDPGLGKSIITIDLAARVSRGRPMPGDVMPGIKGGVVLITPEDGLADTIQPRLARANADLTKIVSIGTIPETTEDGFTYNRPFTLPDDLEILEKAIERVGAVLVIIDPVMAILGTKDTYKDNEVRAILAPVQMLIEKAGACCILVRHLTKGGGDNALYRGGGSIAFIGLARTGLMVVKDPNDDSRNVLSHIKSNVNKLGIGLTYTVASDEEQGDDRPYVVWGEETNLSAMELLATPRKNTGGNRLEILALLQEKAPRELSIADIAEALPEMTMTNLKVTLKRMYDKGDIDKSERGLYHAL